MIPGIPRFVQVSLLLLGVILFGAGIGWELAGLSERISGLPIGYISAVIGGVICAIWSIVWFAWNVFGQFPSWTNKPAGPKAVVVGHKEER